MANLIFCISIMITCTYVRCADIIVGIEENTPIGHALVSVQNTAVENLSPASPDELYYSFQKTSTESEKLFTISVIGTIYTAREIDREYLCPDSASCILNLIVCANDTNRGINKTISVSVDILDVNDNMPIFIKPVISRTISEDAAIGTVINISDSRALDLDSGKFGVQEYSINSVVPFTVEFDKKSSLLLLLNQKLDHEIQAYSFVLTATDGGYPRAFSDSAAVVISVTGVNNYRPIFSKNDYYTTLTLDQPIGVPFFSVSATDPDQGNSGRVQYDLSTLNDKLILDYIGLNPVTGFFTLKKALEGKISGYYKITVIARDLGTPPHSTTVDVYLTILGDFTYENETSTISYESGNFTYENEISTIGYESGNQTYTDALVSTMDKSDNYTWKIGLVIGIVFLLVLISSIVGYTVYRKSLSSTDKKASLQHLGKGQTDSEKDVKADFKSKDQSELKSGHSAGSNVTVKEDYDGYLVPERISKQSNRQAPKAYGNSQKEESKSLDIYDDGRAASTYQSLVGNNEQHNYSPDIQSKSNEQEHIYFEILDSTGTGDYEKIDKPYGNNENMHVYQPLTDSKEHDEAISIPNQNITSDEYTHMYQPLDTTYVNTS